MQNLFIWFHFAILKISCPFSIYLLESKVNNWQIFFSGPFSFTLMDQFIYVMVMTQVTIMTVTVYYHRTVAHRALSLHPGLALFFRFWGWLTTGMIPEEWARIHRYHHAKDDEAEDPHSPWVYGIWYVLFFGVVLYYQAARNRDIIRKNNTRDIKDDWFDAHIFKRPGKYSRFYGVGLMLVIDMLLFGLAGLLIWLIQMLWIPFWAAGVINGVGHYPGFLGIFGYRNTETKDMSSNIVPWAFFIGGEELHNNHHAFPSSAKLSYHPWEFDIGWLYIRIFQILGLAQVKDILGKKIGS